MRKHNDGYVMIYVLVVLAIMEVIALSCMSMALVPQKNLQTSLSRMQEKYTAQGYIERVVASLECEVVPLDTIDFNNYFIIDDTDGIESIDLNYTGSPDDPTDIIKITVLNGKTTVEAEYELTPIKSSSTADNGPTVSIITGYTATCISYDTEVSAS